MRVAGRMLGSLLLGGVAILGSILIFRQGLLPLIEAVFHPGPEWLSVLRRAGILLTAVAGYWAFVHWHEKREATELHLRPIHLMLGGASGAVMVALPLAVLFALGVYEQVLFRGASPALVGVLMAAFGLVPMVCAFHLGKWIDRAGVARPMLIGTIFVAVGAALPFAMPGLPALFVAAPTIGFGFMLFQMAAQRATADLGPDRTANYGLLSLGSSLAHVVGPLAAGLAIDTVFKEKQ